MSPAAVVEAANPETEQVPSTEESKIELQEVTLPPLIMSLPSLYFLVGWGTGGNKMRTSLGTFVGTRGSFWGSGTQYLGFSYRGSRRCWFKELLV
ncbi:hypothetical protein GOBAR_DD18690 [Gossypium barbadense]|nr:hypothetical protein GOBAR_DD18690 [Gossypium barbadense]